MKSNKTHDIFLHYPEIIRKLIIADLNGGSLNESEFRKYKRQLNEIPIIIKCESCYCSFCGEYNEAAKLSICHSCNEKLQQQKQVKYRIKIYFELQKEIKSYDNKKFDFIFEDCLLGDIKNNKLGDVDSKIIIHISPYFSFTEKFKIHNLNLNHIFLNWKNVYELFESKELKKVLNQISEYVFEEKNNVIIWNKINDKIFPKMIKELLINEGHKNVRLGGIGSDQGKDILSRFKRNKWLTQCKFYLKGGSVGAGEIATIDWLATHNCKCYRLAALKVSGSLVTKLKNLDGNKNYGIAVSDFWDEDDLRNLLVTNDIIRRKYFMK